MQEARMQAEGGIFAGAADAEYKVGYARRMKWVQLNNKTGKYDDLPDKKISDEDMVYLMGSPHGIKFKTPTAMWASEGAKQEALKRKKLEQDERHQKMAEDPEVQKDIKKWIDEPTMVVPKDLEPTATMDDLDEGWWNGITARLEEDLDEAIASGEMVPAS
jgi:hypothetical protein